MSRRDVELVVRAKNEASNALAAVTNALEALTTAQADAANGSAAAGNKLGQLAQAASAVRAAFSTVDAAATKAAEAFERQERALAETRAAYAAVKEQSSSAKAAIASLRSEMTAGGAATDETTAKLKAAEAGYRGLSAEARRLSASIEKQEAALSQSRRNLQQVGSSAIAAENALRKVNAAGGDAGKPGGMFANLKPYEIQNLGFQINDLATQIASGTSAAQAFAQQGGQILQIFPGLATRIIAALPQIAAAVAALAAVAGAISRIREEAESVRIFGAALALSADGTRYQAEALAGASKNLDRYGATLEDARAAVAAFAKEGIDPSQIERFGRAAQDLSDAAGSKLPDAAKDIATAFSGGYEAVKKFDDALNFLSAAERARIRELFESGQSERARAEAFAAFERKAADAADKMRGPWSAAARSLGSAWDSLTTAIGTTGPISGAIERIDELAKAVRRLANAASGNRTLQDVNDEIAIIEKRLALRQRIGQIAPRDISRDRADLQALYGERARVISAQPGRAPGSVTTGDTEAQRKARDEAVSGLQRQLESVRAVTDAQRIRLAGENAYRDAINAGANEAGAAAAREAATLLEQTRLQQAAGRAAQARAEAEKRQAQERAAAQREFIEGQRFELAMLSKTDREREILKALRSAEQPDKSDPSNPGGSLAPNIAAQIRETVGALFDQRAALKGNEEIDRARLELAKAQGDELSRAAYIAAALRDAGLEAASEQGKQLATLRGQLFDLEEGRRAAAKADETVNGLLEQRRLILEQMRFYRDEGQPNVAGALQPQLDSVNAALDSAIAKALEFWAAVGGQDSVNATLKLEMLRKQIAATEQQGVLTSKSLRDGFANGLTTAFQTFTQAVANGGNVFKSLGSAFQSFAATFLQQVANMIIQMLALRAAMAIIPGGFTIPVFHSGGVAGDGSNRSRKVHPWALGMARVARYHSGGLAGLAPDEIPAVLQRGEEVLTESDPRHRRNGGLSRGDGEAGGIARADVKIVNAIDAGHLASEMFASRVGQQVFINHIRKNQGAIRDALGG